MVSDRDMVGWIASEMEGKFLPQLLNDFRSRRAQLVDEALAFGNTDREKARVAEIDWIVDYIENYSTYADTETETGVKSDTVTETAGGF